MEETLTVITILLGLAGVIAFFHWWTLFAGMNARLGTIVKLLEDQGKAARPLEGGPSPVRKASAPAPAPPRPIPHLGWKVFAVCIIIYSILATIGYLAGWFGGR